MGSVYPRGGILQFDFRHKAHRCRESSNLPDIPANRRRCETAMKRIEAEIVLGTFDYAAYFPDGGMRHLVTHIEPCIYRHRSLSRVEALMRLRSTQGGG
jgi:Arm DNA-binding domain